MTTTIKTTTVKVTEGYKNWAMNASVSLSTHGYRINNGVFVPLYTISEFHAPLSSKGVGFSKTYVSKAAAEKKLAQLTAHYYNPVTTVEER